MRYIRPQMLGLALFVGLTLVFIMATAELTDESRNRTEADNDYMVDAQYVGSLTCGQCHMEKHDLWEQTLHTQKIRPVSEAIVRGDFDATLELGYDLQLYHVEGTDEYTVELAGTNFSVDWVLGAGYWKQQYMTVLENSTFILPLQWNSAPSTWVLYEPEAWFADSHTLRQEDWGFGGLEPVALNRSWEKECAGCHTTGYTPTQNSNGEWVANEGENLVEYNIGCEACHGPGSLHVNPPTGESRLDYIFYSAESNVCAQCHVRGTSPDGEHGYPTDMYPGDEIWDHFDLATDVFWPDNKTSLYHRQQYMEWNNSGHAVETPAFAKRAPCVNCHTPEGAQEVFGGGWLTEIPQEVTWQITCQACHDPHGTGNEHDLLADKETLCITCHNDEDPEPPATPHHSMYEMLTGQGGIGVIGNLRMGGAVTCTDCHMPKVATNAVAYDVSSHTFEMLEPAVSLRYAAVNMPNSCTSSCHNGVGSGSPLTLESADRVVSNWHAVITDMMEEVGTDLELAETALTAAQAARVDPELVTRAQELYDVAIFNHDLVVNEGSRGVHNFEYARALLFDSQERAHQIVQMLTVDNLPPVARVDLVGETLVTHQGDLVLLDGSNSQDPEGTRLSYAWDFGDGAVATGGEVNHTYLVNGTYTLTLTVTDGDQLSGSAKVQVYVLNLNGETLEDLKDKTTALDRALLDKADRSDLEQKVSVLSLMGVLLLALIAAGSSYFLLKQDLEDLRVEHSHQHGPGDPREAGQPPSRTGVAVEEKPGPTPPPAGERGKEEGPQAKL